MHILFIVSYSLNFDKHQNNTLKIIHPRTFPVEMMGRLICLYILCAIKYFIKYGNLYFSFMDFTFPLPFLSPCLRFLFLHHIERATNSTGSFDFSVLSIFLFIILLLLSSHFILISWDVGDPIARVTFNIYPPTLCRHFSLFNSVKKSVFSEHLPHYTFPSHYCIPSFDKKIRIVLSCSGTLMNI